MAKYRNITNDDYDARLLRYNTEHKVYCEHCGNGHGVIFYEGKYSEDKKICRNCGNYIFRDEKAKLKYEMQKRGVLCKENISA